MSGKTMVDGTERRRVLKTLFAAGGVTALAAVSGSAVAAPAMQVAKPAPETNGYRETDHIRTYYSKARI
jgi:predicted phage tail protein